MDIIVSGGWGVAEFVSDIIVSGGGGVAEFVSDIYYC